MRRLVALLICMPLVANAHEFWIDPTVYQVDAGDSIEAHLRVGENFKGSVQSYLPRNFERFDLKCGSEIAPVEGRAGDRPALKVATDEDGLCVAIHQTRDYDLTYTDWEKFKAFAAHKDFGDVLTRHEDRGLSKDRFVEQYSRYAKSLIGVGDGKGSDSPVGLLTEIVAEANPYVEGFSGAMPVRVIYNGKPRTDVQVELFDKSPSGEVIVTLHRTDDEGRVSLPVSAGHSYLVDAVVLREMQPVSDGDPVWESLWASLTFAVPAAP